MTISNGGEQELSELKELKVRVPMRYHVQLHALKVLTGRPISETVQEALGRYLEQTFSDLAKGREPEDDEADPDA